MPEDFWLESWAHWSGLLLIATGFVFHGVQHRRERRRDATEVARWKENVAQRLQHLEEAQLNTRTKVGDIYGVLNAINSRLSHIEGALTRRNGK